jgi:transcriptional regulator of arginine metabolism
MDEINRQENTIGQDDVQVHGFQRFEYANNLGVVRTLPGFASSIAAAIDHYHSYEIVGTIAGDDTILIIPRDNITKNDIINVLIQIIPELKGRI